MSAVANFKQIVAALNAFGEAPDYAAYARLERKVLDHVPTGVGECAAMLEVVSDNLEAGPRSDERDVAAVKRIAAWLRSAEAQRFVAQTFVAQTAATPPKPRLRLVGG